jgi:hypothetical protein
MATPGALPSLETFLVMQRSAREPSLQSCIDARPQVRFRE